MGWETKKLGEACDVRDGTHDSPKYQDVGFPLITSKNLKPSGLNFEKVKYICKEDYQSISKRSGVSEGDILFAMIGTIGNPIIVGNEIEFAIKNVALIKKNDSVNNYYMKYFLGSNATITKMRVEAKGSTQKFVSLGYLRSFEIPLPPLKTQARIVSILDSAFADIERARANAEKNLKNARELFNSYLNKVFTEGGDGWEHKKILDLSTKLGDGLHGTPKYTNNEEYHFINGNNLSDGYIVIKEKTKSVSKEEYYKHKKNLNDRTILVSINGTLGNVAFYRDEKVILGKSACYFNLKADVNKDFVKFVIQSPVFQSYAMKEATGATIKNVSLKSMRNFKLPVPSLRQQTELVDLFKSINRQTKQLVTTYENKLKSLDELKQSLLQKAFSGELTKEDEGIAA